MGPLFCVIDGPTRGRAWSSATVRFEHHHLAIQARVRRRFAQHGAGDLAGGFIAGPGDSDELPLVGGGASDRSRLGVRDDALRVTHSSGFRLMSCDAVLSGVTVAVVKLGLG